jgi:hypothetical protein
MSNDDLPGEEIRFDIPVWTIISESNKGSYILAHERYGPTFLVFADERAAEVLIEQGMPAGYKVSPIRDWIELRDWTKALMTRGVKSVGIDPLPDLSGQFVRIEHFHAATIRGLGRAGNK